jgi:hypothetical protein
LHVPEGATQVLVLVLQLHSFFAYAKTSEEKYGYDWKSLLEEKYLPVGGKKY